MKAQLDLAAPSAEQDVVFLKHAGVTAGDRAAGEADSPVYDPPEGTALTAIVNPVDLAAQERLGGRIAAGDVVFQIRVSQLATEPVTNDRLVWASDTYMPIRVSRAQLGGALLWIVRCRKL